MSIQNDKIMNLADGKVLYEDLRSRMAPAIIGELTGNPVVFNDGVPLEKIRALKVSFAPKQSGNGDPSPTNVRPITGWTEVNVYRTGKNILPNKTCQADSDKLLIGQDTGMETFGIPLAAGEYTFSCDNNVSANLYLRESEDEANTKVTSSGTTNISVTFTIPKNGNYRFHLYQANGISASNLTYFQLESGSATAYEPYSGATFPVVFPALGKNLFDGQYVNGYLNSNNFITSGTSAKSAIVPCEPNTTYTVKKYESSNRFQLATSSVYPQSDGTCSGYASADSETEYTYTTGADSHYLIIYVSTSSEQATPQMMVNIGSSTEPYEPYDNTVYGGTLDALSGVLTVEYGIIDLGSLSWDVTSGSGSAKFFRSSVLAGVKKISGTGVIANIYCSIFKTVMAASIYSGAAVDNSIGQDDSTNTRIRVKATSYNDDADAFKTAMDGVSLVYELKTPQTFQLNPATIQTLIGSNTIWTDADSIVIDYAVDTKKYVDNGSSDVKDVRVNGTSVLSNGVASIPVASGDTYGAVKVSDNATYGVTFSNGVLVTSPAGAANVKAGVASRMPIVPARQHEAVYYGLAKLAGVDLASGNDTVGVYTNVTKAAIQTMLGVENGATFEEIVSGTTVSITGVPNVKYECGELTSLTIAAPSHGTIDVWFMTGNVPTMLTTSGVVFPSWFDPEYLEPNTTYEFVITDGYGGVTTWERPVSV